MSFERVNREVQAVQLTEPVYDPNGNVLAKKGDWLVVENGRQFYLTAQEFLRDFKQKSEEKKTEIVYVPYPTEPCYPRPWRYRWNDCGDYWYGGGIICGDNSGVSIQMNDSSTSDVYTTGYLGLSSCTYEARV